MSRFEAWMEQNRRFVEAELGRLRALIARRVLWQRRSARAASPEALAWKVIHDEQVDAWLRGEDREAEARFHRDDAGARAASEKIAAAEAGVAAQREACAQAGAPPALDVLCELFALDPPERDLLLLALAPAIDPAFVRLYAYLHDDAERRWATPHLAQMLLGAGRSAELAVRASLLPEGTLRRFDLVIVESVAHEPFSLQRLRADERIAHYALGIQTPDPRLEGVLAPLGDTLAHVPCAHEDAVARTERWIRSSTHEAPNPLVQLVSPGHRGEAAFAAEVARRLGLRLLRLDVRALGAAGAEARSLLRVVEREVVLAQAALFVDLGAIGAGDRAQVSPIVAALERFASLVFLTSREPWPLRQGTLALRLSRPGTAERRDAWAEAFGDEQAANLPLDEVVQQFVLGPESIVRAASLAGSLARARGGPLEKEDVWTACREVAGLELGELGQRIEPCHAWDDIVLPAGVREQLQQIAVQVAERARVYESWGFGVKLGRGRGITALFAGPSGTGKTMAAEVLARTLSLDLVRIDLSGVVSKYVGETEKNLRRVFDAAEQSGAILFFDEADALFGKRTEVKDSHDRYANIEVNYLLQRMEEYAGLAVLATNRKSALDRAFLRRLRFVLDFPFPDAPSRKQIWERVFPNEAPVAGLDLDMLARLELSGGNIKVIALNAAFAAAGESGPIALRHVLAAARREYDKLEKSFPESEITPSARQVPNGSRAARR